MLSKLFLFSKLPLVRLCLAAFCFLYFISFFGSDKTAAEDAQTLGNASAATSSTAWRTQEEERTIAAYKAVSDAVVFITTVSWEEDPFFFREAKNGSGSGIIVDAKQGIVITNFHVIKGAEKVSVTLADGHIYKVRLVAQDAEFDIAILQLLNAPNNMVAIPFGDSSKLEVGQRVLAIGNPFRLSRTLTAGIVSSLNRAVDAGSGHVMRGLIQTDAAINPGNSGGALLDGDGRLVGINTAILSGSGDSAGIGFAVPINQIKAVLPELILTGKVARPWVGWILEDTKLGPVVYAVHKDSPAFNANIHPATVYMQRGQIRGTVYVAEEADFIFTINGVYVTSKAQVEELINSLPKGSSLEVVLRTGGMANTSRTVTIKPILK